MKEYKRLTERRNHIVIDKCCNCENVNNPQGCYHSDCHRIMKNRLAELEDKIEDGTLIELPCKVGDTLYYVNQYAPTPRIEDNIVHTIEMFNARDGFNIRIWTQNGTFYANKMPNVFKTKADAEKKLKELKNER